MKRILTILSVVAFLTACEKSEDTAITPAVKPTAVVGTWTITPNGNSTDAYQYRVNNSNQVEGRNYSGFVSDGSFTVDLIENSIHRITFTSHTLAGFNFHDFAVNHINLADSDTTYIVVLQEITFKDQVNRTDNLPATIF